MLWRYAYLMPTTRKSVFFYWDFFRGWVFKAFALRIRSSLLFARRDSTGYLLRKSLSAFSGVGYLTLLSLVNLRQQKYAINPPGMMTAAMKTAKCIAGLVIASHTSPYVLSRSF